MHAAIKLQKVKSSETFKRHETRFYFLIKLPQSVIAYNDSYTEIT